MRESTASRFQNQTVESTSVQQQHQHISTPTSPYAYAFLMAGCDPDSPTYRGFLYNILVSTHILQTSGSTADIVVLVQMSSTTSHTQLPDVDVSPLTALRVRIKYLTKPTMDNFYNAVMEKFRILELDEYARVLFLDGDLMPYCNLDYLFQLTDGNQPLLQGNVIVATAIEPATASFFLLSPGPSEMQQLESIVTEQRKWAANRTWPPFDETLGWGHEIQSPDFWINSKGAIGRKWNFYAAFADQGLLYHWTKYVKKRVSIVVGRTVENWSPDVFQNGSNVFGVERRLLKPFANYGCPVPRWFPKKVPPLSPYKDYFHFAGNSKPWEMKKIPNDVAAMENATTPAQLWFHALRKLVQQLDLQVDVNRLRATVGRPKLGRASTLHHIQQALHQSQSKA